MTRRVNVIVSNPELPIPEAKAPGNAGQVLVKEGTNSYTPILLDGTASVLGVQRPDVTITYNWRVVSDNSSDLVVFIDDPTALVTAAVVDERQSTDVEDRDRCGSRKAYAPTKGLITQDVVFELTLDVHPGHDRGEPIYVTAKMPGLDLSTLPPGAEGKRLFLSPPGVEASEATTSTSIDTAFDLVFLPADAADGQVLTLEAVDREGNRLQPPYVVRSNTLSFTPDGAGSIRSGDDGPLYLSSAVRGTATTALYSPSAVQLASVGLPASLAAIQSIPSGFSAAGGGKGCAQGAPGRPAQWPNILLYTVPLLYLWLRRPASGRKQPPS